MHNLSEIWNCPDNLKFKCPQTWESLRPTSYKDIRYCTACSKNVYNCSTPKDFVQHAKSGNCVALPNELAHRPEDPPEAPSHMLGEPSQEFVEKISQQISQQEKLISRFRAWWRKTLEIEPLLFQAFIEKTLIYEHYRSIYQGTPRGEKEFAFELLELGKVEKVIEIAQSYPSDGFLRNLVERLVSIGNLGVAMEVANIYDTCNFKVISLNLIASELVKSGQIAQARNTLRMSLQTARNLTRAREKYEQEVLHLATSLGISL